MLELVNGVGAVIGVGVGVGVGVKHKTVEGLNNLVIPLNGCV